VTVPGSINQESIIMNSKKLNPKIYIISRVHNIDDQRRLIDLGAKSVVRPEIEASLSIIKKIFLLRKMSKDEIIKRIQHLRLIRTLA